MQYQRRMQEGKNVPMRITLQPAVSMKQTKRGRIKKNDTPSLLPYIFTDLPVV